MVVADERQAPQRGIPKYRLSPCGRAHRSVQMTELWSVNQLRHHNFRPPFKRPRSVPIVRNNMLTFRHVILAAALLMTAPCLAAPAPDLFTVAAVKVEGSAESAISARDAAMAQGRSAAWTRLFRRLTAAANWRREPMLGEKALERLIRGDYQVSNERRSTTRYLADVTFHFNPNAVRLVLRQANIPYTEMRSPPVLVVPITAGSGFQPASPWAAAWKDPELQQGLVPFITPAADDMDDLFARPDLMQADWNAVAPLANRYNASAVILASASPDGKTV